MYTNSLFQFDYCLPPPKDKKAVIQRDNYGCRREQGPALLGNCPPPNSSVTAKQYLPTAKFKPWAGEVHSWLEALPGNTNNLRSASRFAVMKLFFESDPKPFPGMFNKK